MAENPRPTETPAARMQRQMTDAMRNARPRTPEDSFDPAVPVAATVILLRGGERGPEVLLIERPDRGSFAGAWVFPGGKLEDVDHEGLPSGAAEEDLARVAGVRETREETGLRIDAGSLVTLSRWDPPPGLALRIRTWFFLARAPQGELSLQPAEAIAAQWARPAEILERHGRGELTLYPPTWVTLHGLAEASTVDALEAAARIAGVRAFETLVRTSSAGPVFLWAGDADYAETTGLPASARHRLELGALPWIYTRTQ